MNISEIWNIGCVGCVVECKACVYSRVHVYQEMYTDVRRWRVRSLRDVLVQLLVFALAKLFQFMESWRFCTVVKVALWVSNRWGGNQLFDCLSTLRACCQWWFRETAYAVKSVLAELAGMRFSHGLVFINWHESIELPAAACVNAVYPVMKNARYRCLLSCANSSLHLYFI